MKQAKVWSTSSGPLGIQVRFTSGEARDVRIHDDVTEGVLYYDGDLDLILQNTTEVFRYYKDFLWRYFFFSAEEALKYSQESQPGEDIDRKYIQKCYIAPAKYKPVEPPIDAVLEQGERGLFCKLNLRPDVFGTKTVGKMYFPDRSCKEGLYPGPVVISTVTERTSYGFVVCHMKQYQAPSKEQVADFVIKHKHYNTVIQFCSGKFGEFVRMDGCYCVLDEDQMVILDIQIHKYDPDITVNRAVLGIDIVCEVYQGYNFSDFLDKFESFKFSSTSFVPITPYLSDLFDKAIKCGFLSFRNIHNVDFVEICEDKLHDAVSQFSRSEMDEIIKAVTGINEKANSAIESKIRSGEIRLALK